MNKKRFVWRLITNVFVIAIVASPVPNKLSNKLVLITAWLVISLIGDWLIGDLSKPKSN